MKAPTLQSIRNYACHTLALTSFFQQPGDGRCYPQIPASDLSWALLLGVILRLGSATRLEWLARLAAHVAVAFFAALGAAMALRESRRVAGHKA